MLTRAASGAASGAATGAVAGVLVGSPRSGETILEVLLAEELELTVIEALDELAGHETPAAVELVVLAGEEPGCTRAQAIAAARRHAPAAVIVLVCESIDPWEVRSVLASGAAGIVLAADVASTLVPCLAAARSGQICVPARNGRQLVRPVLSTREKQILGLVVMGYLNSQIAKRLYLAESTVKSHLTSAFGKLEVHSRNEAVDLILNPETGLALGILSLGGEPVQEIASESQ